MLKKCAIIYLAAFPLLPAAAQTDPNLLWDRTTVYRDNWGVPHVYADDPHAMAFAFGFAQAEDHLEAMLFAYRVANGRAAEVRGPEYLESDRFAIRMGHADLARRAYDRCDSTTKALCDGFALGVNSWIVANPTRVPSWAEGVNPADVLALMHSYLTSQAPFDLADAFHPARGTPFANAWAVSPQLSQSGDPFLVINPHMDYRGPYQWYEAHLGAGDYEMYGATLFGVPVIMQGFNPRLGWALAPNHPDTGDIYGEMRRTLGRPTEITLASRMAGAGFAIAQPEVAPFYVWTGSAFEEHYAYRLLTGRGPLVHQTPRRNYYWRLGGYGEFGALHQLFQMGRARSLDAFRAALQLHQLPTFHVVYADMEGNIFYQYGARVGEKFDSELAESGDPANRARRWDGPLPVTDPSAEWGALMPVETLPTLLNPEAGYIQACGTPPWRTADSVEIGPDDWPDWFAGDIDTYRARRVRQLFALGPRSFYETQSMLYDLVSPFAVQAVGALLAAADANPAFVRNADPDLPRCLDLLRDWNYLAENDSTAMTYFHVWRHTLHKRLLQRGVVERQWYAFVADQSPGVRRFLLETASEAAKLVRNQYQKVAVPWGDVHRIRRGARDHSAPGALSGEPLFATWDADFEDGKWVATGGYGFAMVVRFGETPEAVSVVPFGASEVPSSPHYDDQLDLLLERRFKIVRFARDDIERHAAYGVGKRIALRSSEADAALFLQADVPVRAGLHRATQLDETMPREVAAFSPYMHAVVEPQNASTQVYMEFVVPDAVCARQHLSQLALFGFHPQTGWRRVAQQDFVPHTRTFRGRAYGPQAFAVLGPRAHLSQGYLHADGADSGTAEPSREPRVLAEAPRKPQSITPRVESEVERPMTLAARPLENAAGLDTSASPLDSRPLLPGESGKEEPAAEATDPLANVPELVPRVRPSPGEQAGAESTRRSDTRRQPQESTPLPDLPLTQDSRTPEGTVSQGEPVPMPKTASQELAPIEPEYTDAAGRQRVARGDLPVVTGRSVSKPEGVIWSPLTPSRMRELSGDVDRPFVLNPDTKNTSPIRIGRHLQLRSPGQNSLFTVSAEETVRARVKALDVPPGPIPSGMARFTPMFDVIVEPSSAPGVTLAYRIQLEPRVCAKDDFSKLGVYAYDRQRGWLPLPSVKVDTASQIFTGMDFSMSVYTVLGPQEALQRPPSM